MDLTILCITKVESHSIPFIRKMEALAVVIQAEFVIAADGEFAYRTMTHSWRQNVIRVNNTGPSLESVLDEAVRRCKGSYILRLDDDEVCSHAMLHWLYMNKWKTADHWSFPRVHPWQNTQQILHTPELFPDLQTRLSVKMKAGGRTILHSGSPFGFGETAPVCLEHHKFLVKSFTERKVIAERYEAFHPGFGMGQMLAYSLPEMAYKEPVDLWEYSTGLANWAPAWKKKIQLWPYHQ